MVDFLFLFEYQSLPQGKVNEKVKCDGFFDNILKKWSAVSFFVFLSLVPESFDVTLREKWQRTQFLPDKFKFTRNRVLCQFSRKILIKTFYNFTGKVTEANSSRKVLIKLIGKELASLLLFP